MSPIKMARLGAILATFVTAVTLTGCAGEQYDTEAQDAIQTAAQEQGFAVCVNIGSRSCVYVNDEETEAIVKVTVREQTEETPKVTTLVPAQLMNNKWHLGCKVIGGHFVSFQDAKYGRGLYTYFRHDGQCPNAVTREDLLKPPTGPHSPS